MSIEVAAQKRLTVRELQAILADCDPDAAVNLSLPALMEASDKEVVNDPDLPGIEYSFVPKVGTGYMTSKDLPEDHFFFEDGTVRPGVKPNSVTIGLTDVDTEDLYRCRKNAIEADDANDGLEPEPAAADDTTVIVDVRLSRNLHTTIRRLLREFNTSHAVKTEGACTHGLLTVAGALEMLAQDLGMVESRPGSWEGSNMAQVLTSHGYNT